MQIKASSALVTGGASGLGEAAVRRFHGLGASVVIADMNAKASETLARELGQRARFVQTDVTDEQAVARAVRLAVEQHGRLDILLSCAGIGGAKKILGREGPHELDHFVRIIQVNLVGTFNALRLAAEAMANNQPNPEGERGVIINTASVAAWEGQIGQAAYSASKGGIVGLTLPAARELARNGIRVVSIAPGLFDTPMMAAVPEAARASLGEQVPFPSRLGRPEEYAALAQHIVENPMLNGGVIRLDGALRMAAR